MDDNGLEEKYLNDLRSLHLARLRVLKKQAAMHGIDAAPAITNEIPQIEKKIQEIDRQLAGQLIEPTLQETDRQIVGQSAHPAISPLAGQLIEPTLQETDRQIVGQSAHPAISPPARASVIARGLLLPGVGLLLVLVGMASCSLGQTSANTAANAKIETLQATNISQQAAISAARSEIAIFAATSTAASNNQPTGSIDTPKDGADVEPLISVRGQSKYIKDGQTLWLYILAGDRNYYFYDINRFADGSWASNNVNIGTPDASGQTFTLGVIAANAEATIEIRKQRNARPNLPTVGSVLPLANITVIRR